MQWADGEELVLFPMGLCSSILIGFREWLRRDGACSRASAGMQHHSFVNICESLDDAQHDDLAREYICAMADKDCIDDMTGQPLYPVLVDEAKTKERAGPRFLFGGYVLKRATTRIRM